MVSVSGLRHHCIYTVGCGCFLKVCQRYKRALALVTAVSLSLPKLTRTVVGVLYLVCTYAADPIVWYTESANCKLQVCLFLQS